MAKAGQTVSGTLLVSSSKEEQNHIVVTLSDFTRNEEGRVVELTDPKANPRSCRSWIDVDRLDFVSPEKGYVELTVSAHVPDGASGSYWALALLASEPPARDSRMSATTFQLVPRVAIPIVVTVEGTAKPSLGILKTTAVKEEKGIAVESIIENRGNVAVLISAAFALERAAAGTTDAEEVSSATVGPLTSLPGTRLRAKTVLPYQGSLGAVTAHTYVRYGPHPEDTTEATAVVTDASKGGAKTGGVGAPAKTGPAVRTTTEAKHP